MATTRTKTIGKTTSKARSDEPRKLVEAVSQQMAVIEFELGCRF